LERRASVKYPIAPCIQSDGSVQWVRSSS
jgi:hypothetical protein